MKFGRRLQSQESGNKRHFHVKTEEPLLWNVGAVEGSVLRGDWRSREGTPVKFPAGHLELMLEHKGGHSEEAKGL